MACDTIVYNDTEYSRDEFKEMMRTGEVHLPHLSKDDIDVEPKDFKTMPFKYSDRKIVAGKKAITVRPYSYSMGTYKGSNNRLFNVFPEGHMFIKDYLAKNRITKADFIKEFLDDEDARYKHIQEFLDDKKPLYVYRIEKVVNRDDIIPEISDPRFAKVYENRLAIIKRIKGQISAEKDPLKREELRSRMDLAKEQAARIKDDETRTFQTLFGQMKNDVETARRIIDTKVDERSINYAKSLTNNYIEILTNDFNDILNDKSMDAETKQDLLDFITEATDLSKKLNTHFLALANDAQKKLTGKDQLRYDGMPINVDDTNMAAGWSYDTRWNKNPVVQAVTKIIRDSQVTINLLLNEFRATNKKLVHAMRKAKYDYEFMTQTDLSGKRTGLFVTRESAAYKEARAEASKDLNNQIAFYAHNHSYTVNDAAWLQRKEALIDYYKNNNTILLNDQDVANGTSYDEKVERYAHDLAMQKDPNIMKAILDIAAVNPKRLTRADKLFFSRFLQYGGLRAERMGDAYVRPFEMTALDKWIDPKYTTIQAMSQEDPRKAFYDHWVKYIETGRRMRRDEDSYLAWNYIPEKYKPLGILTKAQQAMRDHLGQRLSINKGDIDPETGEVEKKIPLYMLNDTLSPENKSYDLGDVLEDFMKETINYDEKSKIEEPVNMLLSFLRQQQVWDTNPDGSIKTYSGQQQTKQGLSNNYIQAAHRVAASIYGETQEQELVTGWKLYSKEEKERLKGIKDEIDNLGLTAQERGEALQYASIGASYDSDNEKIAAYVALAAKYKQVQDNAHNFTGSKAVNSLMFLTSVKYLGLNLFAGLGEILQGFSSLFTESAARIYFNDSHAARAMGTMMKAMTPWSTPLKEKVEGVAKFFDTVGDIFHESEGRLKGKTEGIAFAQYKIANFQANTSFTIAMLMHDKVKDTKGVEHSIWDAMDFEDGKAKWNKDIPIELYENGKPSHYLIDLNHKSDEVLALNRERKTFMDPIKVDSKMVGRLLGQFKKNWMIGMFYNRFGNHRDANLTGGGHEFEGFYKTFWKEVTSLPSVTDPVTGEEISGGSLFGVRYIGNFLKLFYKYGLRGAKDGEHSALVAGNLRKFMRELSFAMTISTVMLVLSGMNGGDDKDPLRTYFINQLSRLQRDIMSFMSPSDFTSFLKNPAPAISSITDYTAIWDAMMKSAVLGDPYNSQGQLRIWNATRQNLPFYNQINNMKSKFNQAVLYGKY